MGRINCFETWLNRRGLRTPWESNECVLGRVGGGGVLSFFTVFRNRTFLISDALQVTMDANSTLSWEKFMGKRFPGPDKTRWLDAVVNCTDLVTVEAFGRAQYRNVCHHAATAPRNH